MGEKILGGFLRAATANPLEGFSSLFEYKALVKEVRVVELDPADQFNGVMSPLPHAPDLWDSHGKEDEAFNPFGAFGNSSRVEDAFRSTIFTRKSFQDIVGHQLVRNRLREVLCCNQALHLVPS